MIQRIIDVIHSCETFLITSHVRLDGDALGSELALWHVINDMGKKAVVYNQDTAPEMYQFLPGCDAIQHELASGEKFDAVFVLDCSESERAGNLVDLVRSSPLMINIDHHISNTFFSELSLVDVDASSTGEILYRIIKAMGISVTKDVATNLYTAILTDTGSFRYSNTTPATFAVVADLVNLGADPREVAENVYETKPLVQMHLLKEALNTLEVNGDRKIGSIVVTREMVTRAGALQEHTEGFVDLVRSIRGVDIALFFHETAHDVFKISLRSKGTVNVEKIARAFGGGGHLNASACTIAGDIKSVKRRLLGAIE